jgi:hypothetical protein
VLLEVLRLNEALVRDEALVEGGLFLVADAEPAAGEGWAGPHAFDVEGQPLTLYVRRV